MGNFDPTHSDYISQIVLPGSQKIYYVKDAEARDWIEQLASAGIKFTIAWDGENVPDVTKIPAGVIVTYNNVEYVGTLPASDITAPFIQLVFERYSGSGLDARKIYGEYITVTVPAQESGESDTYFWEKLGNTDIVIDDLGALAYKDNASGSTSLETADSASFSNGSANVTATYTPAGSVSTPTITVVPSTTSVQVKDQDGSVTAGSQAQYTRGSFSGGSFTQGTDQFTAPVLTAEVAEGTETLTIGFNAGSFTQGSDTFNPATHGDDNFVPNTPTAVVLPTFAAQTVATGITSATSSQPTFSGTEATIDSTGTASGDVSLTKTAKTINVTVV